MFSAARGPLPVQALASTQRTFEIKPVTLPSGRGRLTTKPLPTGLLSAFREESGRQSTEPHYNRLRTNRSEPEEGPSAGTTHSSFPVLYLALVNDSYMTIPSHLGMCVPEMEELK